MKRNMILRFGCITFLAFTALLSSAAPAQTVDDTGEWLALFANGDLSVGHGKSRRPLKWWFDGHARFFDDTDGFGQSIVRPGIGYALSDSAVLWAGYGWIRTSPAIGPGFDEDRVWQQITWSKELNATRVGFRSRLEQRFLETGSDTGWRFRQLVSARRPLWCDPRFTAVVWDEVFLNLNDTNWGAVEGFDQNRIFVGGGVKWHIDSPYRVEVGYLNQYVNRTGAADLSNHLISVNLYWNPR